MQESTFTQRRRWLRTRFRLGDRQLDYRIESRRDTRLEKRIGWEEIGWRPDYAVTLEPDAELRWLAFVLTALAAMATFGGKPQPLTLFLYGGTTLALIAGLALTARLRRVGYTAIPAADSRILVLADRHHDDILGVIEGARAASLLRYAEPEPGVSLRAYLRRLRWLSDNGVIARDECARRQRLAMPDDMAPQAPPLLPAAAAPMTFRQRRLGVSIDIALHADRLVYRHARCLGTTEQFTLRYDDMRAPASFHDTDRQHELTAVLLVWCAIVLFSVAAAAAGPRAAGSYVGAAGLARFLSDFGPALLALVPLAVGISALTRARYVEPHPSLRLLQDSVGEAIGAEIERRRLAARRLLAQPDPLLTVGEQMQLLDELREEGVIDAQEHARAATRAEFVCGNPALDAMLMPESNETRALH